jgi:putative cardiolipin synthase
VRVRILLDDIHTFGFDRHIATLNKHPRIEVRLFNPFTYRSSFRLFRLLELVFKLSRLNHRMHNKLLLVDNLFAVLGGRNIADEYFGLNEQFTFHDLDLLITGASIEELSSSFDLYWNHRYSFTARRLIALRTPRRALNRLRRQLKQQLARNANALITIQDMATALMQPVTGAETALALHFPCLADARVFYDSPAFDTHGGEHTVDALYQALQNTRQSLLIVSAYFVPDERLLNALLQHAARGTRIRIFTNSLASVDVTAVFSGYQRCRQQLLAAGVELFEYRAYRPRISHFAPRCSLHMKSIVYDARTLYVGTFNLDPRSTSLNTEIGLLIDCPMLAQQLVDSQTRALEQAHYWQLRLDTTHTLCWHSADATLTRQPARSWQQRLLNQVLALLPIRRHL